MVKIGSFDRQHDYPGGFVDIAAGTSRTRAALLQPVHVLVGTLSIG